MQLGHLSLVISRHTLYTPYPLVCAKLTYQKQCITNLAAVLEAAGSSIASVVKVNVFLADMKNFAEMNEVYEQVCRCGMEIE